MNPKLVLPVALVLAGVLAAALLLRRGPSADRTADDLPAPGPVRPAQATPVEGDFVRLLGEVERMGYALPARSIPAEAIRRLAAAGFQIEDETLDPAFCHRLGGYREELIVSWLCRTRFPVALDRGTDPQASDAAPTPYGLARGDPPTPLRPFDPTRDLEADVWKPRPGGFALQVARPDPVRPPSERYRVRYPVDAAALARLNWADAGLEARAFLVRDLDLDGDLRPALYAPAPATLVFPLRVPPAGRLQLGIGVLEEGWRHSDGVDFAIAIREPGGEARTLFSKHLDPRARPEHRRWRDLDLDLAAFSGRRVELLLETRPGPGGDARYDAAAFASPIVYRRADDATPVVFVDIDTLRADHLEVYGYPRPTSPVLRAFAREAVVFERAIAQAPYTLPSQMSILTGLRQDRHGVVGVDDRLAPGVATLATLLGQRGYFTKAITDGGGVSFRFGYGRGFDSYWEFRGHRGTDSDFATDLLRRFRSWLDAWTARSVFLFLHTYETHYPYRPPREERLRFDPDYRGKIMEAFDRYYALQLRSRFEFTRRDLQQIVARYDGEIRYTDAAVGEIFAMLKTRGLYEDSVIVVLSDHGDEFYEHGHFNHGHSLYEELIRVPLLIRFPGGAFGGRRIAAPVELIDVLPTVLDFLGHPIPDGLDGTSAWPLVRRGADEAAGRAPRYAISEAEGVGIAVRSATHKLIRTEAGDAVYALREDPGETRDVYDPKDPRVQELVRVLDAHLAERDGRGGGPPPDEEPGAAPLDPELEDHLRALGYLR